MTQPEDNALVSPKAVNSVTFPHPYVEKGRQVKVSGSPIGGGEGPRGLRRICVTASFHCSMRLRGECLYLKIRLVHRLFTGLGRVMITRGQSEYYMPRMEPKPT